MGRMRYIPGFLFIVTAAFSSPTVAFADEPRDALKVAAEIDTQVERQLKAEKLSPAKPADDVEFLRRVYLDLSGSVPTREQAASFLDDASEDKRQKLIDELLASPRFGEQFGN